LIMVAKDGVEHALRSPFVSKTNEYARCRQGGVTNFEGWFRAIVRVSATVGRSRRRGIAAIAKSSELPGDAVSGGDPARLGLVACIAMAMHRPPGRVGFAGSGELRLRRLCRRLGGVRLIHRRKRLGRIDRR